MKKEPRYEVRSGKYGQYFHDADEGVDMGLENVLALLNGAETEIHDLDRECQRLRYRLKEEESNACAVATEKGWEREEKERLSAENKRLKDEIAEHIANTQSALAEKNALAADLEREHEGNETLRLRHGARDDETMFQFLARLAGEKVDLEAANNALRRDLEELDEKLGGERDKALAAESNYARQLEDARQALDRAKVAECQDQRVLSVAERIAILARRSTPHEDPARTAYVAGLERAARQLLDIGDGWVDGATDTVDRHKDEFESSLEQLRRSSVGGRGPEVDKITKHRVETIVSILRGLPAKKRREFMDRFGLELVSDLPADMWDDARRFLCEGVDDVAGVSKPTGLVIKAHHDGEVAALKDELRAAHDEAGWLTEHNEMLKATNKHLTDKLTRIVELIPPYTEVVDGRKIMAVATEQLSPSDPAMVEIERVNMLKEIDDVLQKAGCWRGGRLDSILELVTRHQGMWACLKLALEWIERDGPAIRSWVEEN